MKQKVNNNPPANHYYTVFIIINPLVYKNNKN